MIIIFLILIYFLVPGVLIYLCQRYRMLDKIGAVVLAYGMGLLMGNTGILPHISPAYLNMLGGKSYLPSNQIQNLVGRGILHQNDIIVNQILHTQHLLLTIIVPTAIPLLLFSLNVRKWISNARHTFLSFTLGITSVIVVIITGNYLFQSTVDHTWQISGMLTGIYSGGTPNLAAISTALKVKPDLFIITHSYDMIIGAFCLLFLVTIAQRLFNSFLPVYRLERDNTVQNHKNHPSGDPDSFSIFKSISTWKHALTGMLFSLMIFAISGALSLLVPKQYQMLTVILSITTLALLLSMHSGINEIPASYQTGMYLIVVFSLVVSSMADLQHLLDIQFLSLFLFVLLAVFGSMCLHIFLSWIFKVDADTTIITITALTFSPPFVPVVAASLKNKEIIISGLTSGILGYAIGNYLGIALAYLLR